MKTEFAGCMAARLPSSLGCILLVAAYIDPMTALSDERKTFDAQSFQLVELEPTNPTAVAALAAQQPTGELAEMLKEAGQVETSSALVDLNNDNIPEVVIQIESPVTCGVRDCEVVILMRTGASNHTVFEGSASQIGLGKISETGWRDIITNPDLQAHTGAIWTWNGADYEID